MIRKLNDVLHIPAEVLIQHIKKQRGYSLLCLPEI